MDLRVLFGPLEGIASGLMGGLGLGWILIDGGGDGGGMGGMMG